MDISKIKAQLERLQEAVSTLEIGQPQRSDSDVVVALQDHISLSEAQTRLQYEILQMQIAVEGPASYLDALRNEPLRHVALLVGLRSGLIRTIVEAKGAPLTASHLAETCGMHQHAVVRVMRFLASAMSICIIVGAETYASSEVAELLFSPLVEAQFGNASIVQWPVAANFTPFLDDVGWKRLGQEPSPYTHLFGGTLWEVLGKDPEKKRIFDRMFSVRAQSGMFQTWQIYPVESLLKNYTVDVALVDIGGNRGHDLLALIKACPEVGYQQLVLQDLPATLDKIAAGDLPGNIEKQAYDFFSGPQPVKGAVAYLMHNILHDYDDLDAATILQHTVEAMSSTSRLLIAEWVVDDRKPQKQACLVDWTMMLATTGGMERSSSHWTKLLSAAGLTTLKVWSPKLEGHSVIEVVKA